jgi:hypothetical protein
VTPAFVCCLCGKRIGRHRAHALLNQPSPRIAHITCVWQHHRLDDTQHTGTRAGIAAYLFRSGTWTEPDHVPGLDHQCVDARRARAAEAID